VSEGQGGPVGRGELEAFELEGGADGAGDEGGAVGGVGGLPGPGGDQDLGLLAGGQVRAEDVDGDRLVALLDAQGHGGAEVVQPELVGVDPVPIRPLALPQQEVDRGPRASAAVARVVTPGLPVVTPLGVRLEAEVLDDLVGVHGPEPSHVLSTAWGHWTA
jgi:hypothetical protein